MIWGIFCVLAAAVALACAVQAIVKIGVKKASISFSLTMLGLAILYLASGMILLVPFEGPGIEAFILKISVILFPGIGTILPFLFLVTSRNYGRMEETGEKRMSTLTALAGLITILIAFFIASGLISETLITGRGYVLLVPGFLAKAVGLVLGVILIVSLLNFANTRRASRGALRMQLLALIALDVLLLAGVVRLFFLGMLTSQFIEFLAPLNLLCIAWLYFLLLPENAYSANVIVDRQAFLSSATILFLGIFLVFTGVVAYIIKQLGGHPDIFLSILGAFLVIGLFLLVLLSDSIRGRFSSAYQSRLYAGRFDYRAEWRELSEDFVTCNSVSELVNMLASRIKRLIKPEDIAIFMEDGKRLTARYFQGQALAPIDISDPLANWVFLNSSPALLVDLDEPSSSRLGELKNRFEVIVPIIGESRLMGSVLAGRKESGQPYNTEDLALLSVMVQQAAITILHLRARDKLVETERLASFHKTASFVVHDLKNAVSMLSLMLQNSPKKMSDPEFQADSIKTISQAVDRMRAIIEKLRTVPAGEQFHVQEVSSRDIIDQAIEKSGILNKDGIKLVFNHDDDLKVNANPMILETVLINLLINAVEAMPGGGTVSIKQTMVDDKARISVEDTGVGMTDDFIAEKLFTPFETTKSKGLGIGLYQCRELFRETGGEITVKSEPGKGSEFGLLFP
jgi:putative PEP-CTERM system histidine kinase